MAAAIGEGSSEELKLLLDAGADIEANMSSDFKVEDHYSTTVKNITPLLLAVALDQQELVSLLLARRASIDSIHDGLIDCYHYGIDVKGAMTSLTLAIQMGKLPMVQLLTDQGANLEQRDAEGRTPLHYAVDESRTEIVKYLLKKGADPGAKDIKGQTALQHAALAGNVEIGKLLESGDLQYRQLEKTQWKDAQEQFTAYVSALSSDPQNVLLRRKVIALGAALPTPPAVPDAAKQYFVLATQQIPLAKTPSALDTPIALLRKTIDLAPWWGNGYYNLGVALQMNSKFDESITMLQYYLDSKPSAADAAEAQTRIQAARTAKNAAK
jgi:tetratricopeptide (TPR) repeat protein